jgi:hypothetical protein
MRFTFLAKAGFRLTLHAPQTPTFSCAQSVYGKSGSEGKVHFWNSSSTTVPENLRGPRRFRGTGVPPVRTARMAVPRWVAAPLRCSTSLQHVVILGRFLEATVLNLESRIWHCGSAAL